MNAPVRPYTIRVEDGDPTLGEYTHVFGKGCADPILRFWSRLGGSPPDHGWQLEWINPDGLPGNKWLVGGKDDLGRVQSEAESFLDAHIYRCQPEADELMARYSLELRADTKSREERARRLARDLGLIVRKSRRRNPRAADFGLYVLVEDSAGNQRPGAQAAKSAFADGDGMTLLEVEEALKSVVGL